MTKEESTPKGFICKRFLPLHPEEESTEAWEHMNVYEASELLPDDKVVPLTFVHKIIHTQRTAAMREILLKVLAQTAYYSQPTGQYGVSCIAIPDIHTLAASKGIDLGV